MTLTIRDMQWEKFVEMALARERMFPELDGAISSLFMELRSVWALYADTRVPDRRLFSVDIENLADGLEMLTDLRKAGVHDERMTDALGNVISLARNMQMRAKALIEDKINAAVIHTSVASLGLKSMTPAHTPNTPIVLTDAETHASEGAGSRPMSLAMSDIGLSGRVSGEFVFGKLSEDDKFKHVKTDLFFLPANRVLTVREDEVVALWAGHAHLSTSDVLRNKTYRIEPGTSPIEIHGPVFVSQVVSARKILTPHREFRLEADPDTNPENTFEAESAFMMLCCGLVLLGAGTALSSALGVHTALPSPGEADILAKSSQEVAGMMSMIAGIAQVLGIITLLMAPVKLLVSMSQGMSMKENVIKTALRHRRNRKITAVAAAHGIVPWTGESPHR